MLVEELILACRDQLDEDNTSDLSDAVVLRAINRAQQKLVRLSGRHYTPLFRREANVTTDGSRDITIPEAAFGSVVNEVNVLSGSAYYEVRAAALEQLTAYDITSGTTTIPTYYAQQGDKLKLYPTVASGVTVRVRYQLRPSPLVVSQGRLTASTTTTATLDTLGSGLTTSIASLQAFVNVVDSTTGLVKATLQVSGINTTTKVVTFKSSGLDRSVVFGQTVAVAVPSDVAVDDLVCIASGTCIPSLLRDYSDYLIQYAVVELKRKLGEPGTDDAVALQRLEDDVKSMWAGRESFNRVNRNSPHWGGRSSLLSKYR